MLGTYGMTLHRLDSSKTIAFLLLTAAVSLVTSRAYAATSTFVQGATTWNNTNSWADGDISGSPPTLGGGHVPNALGDVAILQQRVTANAGMTSGSYGISLGSGNMKIGTLTVRNTNNEYTTALQTGTLTFDNGASQAQFNEGLGTGTSNASRTRINVPVVLSSDLVVTQDHNLARNTATEFVQQVTADATKTLVKQGLGSLQFAYDGASDGFLGTLDISSGTVRLINGSATPNPSTIFSKAKSIIVRDGTQFQLGNTVTSFTLGTTATNPAITTPDGKAELLLNGLASNQPSAFNDGALRFEQTAGGNVTVNFNSPIRLQTTSKIYVTAPDTTAVLNEELRGDGAAGLTKGGAGVFKLTTTSANGNPYSGTTVVSRGTLVVNNTVSNSSGVGSGNLNINDTGNGAALGGTGYIGTVGQPVNVTLSSTTVGARLYPGDINARTATVSDPSNITTSVGTLTIHGALTFDAMSSLNVDMTSDTAYDKVIVDGAISLADAGLNFSLGSFSPSGNGNITLIDNLGAGAISGIFGALNGTPGALIEGAPVALGSATYHITYQGGTGNDVVLVCAALGVPGDFNSDGKVDAGDYVIWRKADNTNNALPNDNGLGVPIGASHYALWRANFGNPPGSGSGLGVAEVPEPATIVMVALTFSFLVPLSTRRNLGRTRL